MVALGPQLPNLCLRELFPTAQFQGSDDIPVTRIASDARRVQPGDLFVAIEGADHDGHDDVADALERGATAVLAERPLPVEGRSLCIVPDTRVAYGRICHALAGNPSESLKVVGITGTNGKTTTARLVSSVLAAGGFRTGTLGALGLDDSQERIPATQTTPPAATSAHWLARMVAAGCTHAVMEVSSHALSERRIAGIELHAVCFTNLLSNHLEYHGTRERYHRVKARLLECLRPDGLVVLQVDDPGCAALRKQIDRPVLTVARHAQADITATLVERHLGEQTVLLTAGGQTAAVRTRMFGDHHIKYCLCAAALGLAEGLEVAEVAHGLEAVEAVAGCMERIDCGQPFAVFVDSAQTPEALASVTACLRETTPGNVFCVLGACGERDRERRPAMAAAVGQAADLTVITSDNPRGEDPRNIADDLLKGISQPDKAWVQLDRERAIQSALRHARPGDTVLIAGKGHATYQEIGRQRYYFDDREVVRDWLYRNVQQEAAMT